MTEDLYKILQVDPEADPEVIQAAYRRLARKYHPDVAPGEDGAARMAALNRAWAVLGDPERRAAHDRTRAEQAARLRASERAGADGRAPEAPGRGGSGTGARAPSHPSPAPTAGPDGRGPDPVSRDWTSGRSFAGGHYDPSTMRAADGLGAAGPPPGNPSGTVLTFGRYAGWSLGEIARRDLEYMEWLDRTPIGRPYRDEIDAILRKAGRRRAVQPQSADRRGLFRRR